VNLPKLDSLEEDFREEAELPRRALNILEEEIIYKL